MILLRPSGPTDSSIMIPALRAFFTTRGTCVSAVSAIFASSARECGWPSRTMSRIFLAAEPLRAILSSFSSVAVMAATSSCVWSVPITFAQASQCVKRLLPESPYVLR